MSQTFGQGKKRFWFMNKFLSLLAVYFTFLFFPLAVVRYFAN